MEGVLRGSEGGVLDESRAWRLDPTREGMFLRDSRSFAVFVCMGRSCEMIPGENFIFGRGARESARKTVITWINLLTFCRDGATSLHGLRDMISLAWPHNSNQLTRTSHNSLSAYSYKPRQVHFQREYRFGTR